MAVNKKALKKNKKKQYNKTLFYSFILLTISIIILFLYQYKDAILYYLSFKSKHNNLPVKEKIHQAHIYEVLNSHKDCVFGFDVSQYQGYINWDNIGYLNNNYQMKFVFIRATAGNNKKDTKYNYNWKKSKENNYIRGAYHYYRPNENSIEQAKFFIENVKLVKGDLPPVLDIEKLPQTQSLDSLKVGLKRWLKIVEKHYNVKPIVYSGESYYTDFLKNEFSSYPLWIANYNFWRKSPEKDWKFWQFTEKGVVNGISTYVDINLYNGNILSLNELRIK